MRLGLSTFLSWLATLASCGVALGAEPPASRLEVGGESSRPRWVAVTWQGGGEGKLFDLPAGSKAAVLAGVPPGLVMICAGAEDLATVCERRVLEPGGMVPHPGPSAAGSRVFGRILLGRRPAASAEISLLPDPLPLRWPFSLPLERHEGKGPLVHRVTADAQGRFRIAHLAPGTYRLEMTLPGGRSERSDPITVLPPPPVRSGEASVAALQPVLDLGDLVLPEGLELTVSAVNRQGQPLAGVKVSVRQPQEGAGTLRFVGETDAQGISVLAGLDGARRGIVTCNRSGYELAVERFETFPGRVRCTLFRLAEISGRVVDSEDRPIQAHLTLEGGDGGSTSAGKDGSFTLPELRPRSYRLVAAAPGFRAERRTVDLQPEERLALPPIRLLEADSFTGLVVDGASREPLAGAAVEVTDPPGGGTAVTDENGKFTLAIDQPGEIRLAVRTADYPKAFFPLPPAARAPEAAPTVLELWPGGRIHITIWNEETDKPCLGCSVNLQGPLREGSAPLVADARGEILTEPLSPGVYQLALETVASTSDGVQVSGGDYTRTATVRSGQVAAVRFGERRPMVEVELVPPPPAGTTLAGSSRAGLRAGSMGADGRFRIRKAPGETVALSLGTPGTSLTVYPAELPADFAGSYLRLGLARTSVSGTLVRAGAPLGRIPVALVSAADGKVAASGLAEATGAWSAAFVPPGAYALQVEGQGVAHFQIEEGTPLDLGAVEVPGPR